MSILFIRDTTETRCSIWERKRTLLDNFKRDLLSPLSILACVRGKTLPQPEPGEKIPKHPPPEWGSRHCRLSEDR